MAGLCADGDGEVGLKACMEWHGGMLVRVGKLDRKIVLGRVRALLFWIGW